MPNRALPLIAQVLAENRLEPAVPPASERPPRELDFTSPLTGIAQALQAVATADPDAWHITTKQSIHSLQLPAAQDFHSEGHHIIVEIPPGIDHNPRLESADIFGEDGAFGLWAVVLDISAAHHRYNQPIHYSQPASITLVFNRECDEPLPHHSSGRGARVMGSYYALMLRPDGDRRMVLCQAVVPTFNRQDMLRGRAGTSADIYCRRGDFLNDPEFWPAGAEQDLAAKLPLLPAYLEGVASRLAESLAERRAFEKSESS